ncbi:hypothetical protein C8R44DRAFT_822587 [Mycena epipterygia]|nr:hypothetical protein C8R44DRAFT_822587 [Mycena epipterygia]
MFRPALRRVNRVGIFLSSPRWRPNPTCSRSYALKTPPAKQEAVLSPPPPLPASPEPFTTPLVESDFVEYLDPLYTRGWSIRVARIDDEPGFVLTRVFHFPSTKDLVTFSENTRNLSSSAGISVASTTFRIDIRSRTLNRSLIRHAIEAETEYQKIVGSGVSAVLKQRFRKIYTPESAQALLDNYKSRDRPSPLPLVPITPVLLPPAPAAPVLPPISITDADVETYIKPLVKNGWLVGGIRGGFSGIQSRSALSGHPALSRAYRFRDYTSARDFLHAVVAASTASAPASHSFAGFELRFGTFPFVGLWSISELAEGAPKKYGISHTDVRLAIAVENEFLENWAGRAEHLANTHSGKIPSSMEEVWNYKKA